VELMSKSPVPVTVQYAIIYISTIISIFCGILFLRRVNWSRYLYITWAVIGYVFSLITSPMKLILIPSLIVSGVIFYLLLRKPANEYFKYSEANADGPKNI
jgi:hypothetical protein